MPHVVSRNKVVKSLTPQWHQRKLTDHDPMPLWHREVKSSKTEMPHRWSWAARQDNRFWWQPQPVPRICLKIFGMPVTTSRRQRFRTSGP